MRSRAGLLVAAALFVAAVAVILYLALSSGGTLALVAYDNRPYSSLLAYTQCSSQRHEDVKAWPQFKSSKPLFGEVPFHALPNYDEVGKFHVAVDESKGTDCGYDLLYFDANGNLDLTDDKPAVPKEPPSFANSYQRGTIFFSDISMAAQEGDGVPGAVISPRLFVGEPGRASVSFDPAFVRRGNIRIGGRKYEITLATRSLSARYDTPSTAFLLYRPQKRIPISSRGILKTELEEIIPGPSNKTWYIKDKWYTLRPSPSGDRVSVERYDGATGLIQAGHLNSYLMMGELRNREREIVVVPSGYASEACRYPTHQARLPVGDYAIVYMNFMYGVHNLSVQPNWLPGGPAANSADRSSGYFIKIRDDKAAPQPFVLQWPKSAVVQFVSPETSARFKPWGTITVRAGLVDPERNHVIDNLTTNTLHALPATIDPVVKISSAGGKVIMEKQVDFEDIQRRGVPIDIPADVEIAGPEEEFTLSVTYDTKDIFGAATEGRRQIVIENAGAKDDIPQSK